MQSVLKRSRIVWKVAISSTQLYFLRPWRRRVIVKLRLPAGTRVNEPSRSFCTLLARKCRASGAVVLEVQTKSGKPLKGSAVSVYDGDFEYKAGHVVVPSGFDRSHNRCGKGIHYFRRRTDAVAYCDQT